MTHPARDETHQHSLGTSPIVTYQGPSWLWLSILAVMGIGAKTAAASSVIMLAATEDCAGMAASIEETPFELGGAIGIAVLGSVMTALYTRAMIIPAGLSATVADRLNEALMVAEILKQSGAAKLAASP